MLDAAIFEFAEHGFAGRASSASASRPARWTACCTTTTATRAPVPAVLGKIYTDMIGAQRKFVTPDDPVEGMRQLIEHSWDHYVCATWCACS